MSDPATSRRFVCRGCGYIHAAWAPRCKNCLSLAGLAMTDKSTAPPTQIPPSAPSPSLSPPVVDSAPSTRSSEEPRPESVRPRLMVVRAPDPDLEDPVEELADVDGSERPIPLSDVPIESLVRDSTGLAPLDHVLGGGLVVASVVLLASPPGSGKSSLSLQMLNGLDHRCMYVSGEETREAVAATARRVGAASKKIYVLTERNLSKIFTHARAIRAQTIVIDSIQKMLCEDLDSRAGTPAQLKECTARLVQYAKTTNTSLWLVGHITGDGAIAGPKTIEHDVDVVLELTQGAALNGNERILRVAGKNRHGRTDSVGRFEMTDAGLVPIDGDGWNEEL